MTLKESINMAYSVSDHGYINNTIHTKKSFTNYIKECLGAFPEKPIYFEILCKDGKSWLCKIFKFGSHASEYDFFIPCTQDEERRLVRELDRQMRKAYMKAN